MTEDEARKLATRIIDTWPTGPKAYVWRDNLAELDRDTAALTYRQLIAEADKAPTVAQFLGRYHGNRRRNNAHDTHTGPTYDGPVISFGEYMNRLVARSNGGDQEAADEIARWERFYGKTEP